MRIFLAVKGYGDMTIEAGPAVSVGRLVDALLDAPEKRLPADRVHSLRVERSGAVLAPDRPLAEHDLRSGDIVEIVEIGPDTAFDEGPDRSAEPEAALRMLTGPRAGSTYKLAKGTSSVGRTAANDVVIIDPGISRRHATITVDASSVIVTDRGSTNGIVIDGRPIDGPTSITSGQRLLLGQSWAAVDHFPGPVVPIEGKVFFDRPGSTVERYSAPTIHVPAPPSVKVPDRRLSANLLGGHRGSGREQIDRYHAALDAAIVQLDESHRREREARLRESPSLADVVAAARAQTRLWERELTDPEVLEVRLGLAELPSRVKVAVESGGPPELRARANGLPRLYATLDGVPATFDLGASGGLILRGAPSLTRPLAYSLVGQLVGLNRPDHLGIVFAGDETEPWDWLKWLPHADVDGTGRPPVGEDAGKLIDRYLTAERGDDAPAVHRPPMVLAIVDGSCPDVDRLVAEGFERGIHPLILVDPERDHDGAGGGTGDVGGSSATLTVDGRLGHLSSSSGQSIGSIALDTCAQEAVANLARLLAPLTLRPPTAPDVDGLADGGDGDDCDGDDGDGLDVEPLHLGDGRPVALDLRDGRANGSRPAESSDDPAVRRAGSVDLLDLPRPEDDSRLVLGTVHLDSGSTAAVFAFNPSRDGSLGLVGGPGSGKSESLLTVAAVAAMLDVPTEILPQIYVADAGDRLEVLDPLPSVVGAAHGDPTAANDVLVDIEQLLGDRLLTFELAGADSIDDFRRLRPSVPLSWVLVVIDDLGALAASLEAEHPGRTREVVGQLLEFGSGLGVHLVFSATDPAVLDPPLIPKVGRWLEFGPDGSDPGRATVGAAEVRFAAIDGGREGRDVEGFFSDLAANLLERGLVRPDSSETSEPANP